MFILALDLSSTLPGVEKSDNDCQCRGKVVYSGYIVHVCKLHDKINISYVSISKNPQLYINSKTNESFISFAPVHLLLASNPHQQKKPVLNKIMPSMTSLRGPSINDAGCHQVTQCIDQCIPLRLVAPPQYHHYHRHRLQCLAMEKPYKSVYIVLCLQTNS